MSSAKPSSYDIDILKSGNWFASLPDTVQHSLADVGVMRTLTASQILFAQAYDASGLHAVIKGELHITGTSVNGNDVIMAIIRPGEWTGFLTCLDHGPHAYSATAATEATIMSLRPAAVAAIFETDVATYRLLQSPELIAARKLAHFVIEDLGLPLAQRVAARLADLGRWAYGPASGPVAELDHVSQEELAMSVHASRQKVNMILRDLVERGLIEIGYGRIRVLDLAALERFAHEV
jgi:CRP-like cAMP-binding protein